MKQSKRIASRDTPCCATLDLSAKWGQLISMHMFAKITPTTQNTEQQSSFILDEVDIPPEARCNGKTM